MKALYLRGAKNKDSMKLRGKFSFVLCLVVGWRLHFLPGRAMEQFNLCPANSLRHSFRGQIGTKSIYVFKSNICKTLLFQRFIQPLWPHFKENVFCGTVPLRVRGDKRGRKNIWNALYTNVWALEGETLILC